MEIIFHNGDILDGIEYTYPFPNCIQFKTKRYSIGIGVLGMTGDTWEEKVMCRVDRPHYKQFRFLIFAAAIEMEKI